MNTQTIIPTRAGLRRAGEVRERILAEHRSLRQRLDVLELMVDGLREEPARRASVKRAARDLLRRLIAHTQLEDAIVAPSLRTADAWGDVRAHDLIEQHVAQRQTLTGLLHSYDANDEPLEHAALRTLSWIMDIRADMDHEERTVLSRELFGGWRVAIDGEAG